MKNGMISQKATKSSSFGDLLRITLILGDAFFFMVAQLLAFWLRLESFLFEKYFPSFAVRTNEVWEVTTYFNHLILGVILFIVIGISSGVYSRKSYLRSRYSLLQIFKVICYWVGAYLLISLFFKIEPAVSRVFVILSGVIGMGFIYLWRLAINRVIRSCNLYPYLQQKVLVVGWTKEVQQLWEVSSRSGMDELKITGVLTVDDSKFTKAHPSEIPSVGTIDDIERILKDSKYDVVLLADTHLRKESLSRIVLCCHKMMVGLMAIPNFFEVLMTGLHLESIKGIPVITMGKLPLESLLNRSLKRLVDIVGGVFGLFVFSPVIALFSYLVWRESPGPIFYTQIRTGLNGKDFKINKIRSMKLNAEEDTGAQWAQEDDPRRLLIGAFMRKWNIDELPQFWNVFKGEMSLVGPRPERPELIYAFREEVNFYNTRHSVKPGITGWAAVNGWRGNTCLKERIRFDLDYIERWSLLFDFYIMLRTFIGNKNAY